VIPILKHVVETLSCHFKISNHVKQYIRLNPTKQNLDLLKIFGSGKYVIVTIGSVRFKFEYSIHTKLEDVFLFLYVFI
jgi:hypothetical protein